MRSGRTGSSIWVKTRGACGFSLWLGLVLCSGTLLPATAQTTPAPADANSSLHQPAHVGEGGTVRGIITDASAAAVPEAEVTLAAGGADRRLRAQAAADGSFVVVDVPSGAYAITIEREGFEPWHGSVQVCADDLVTVPAIVLTTLAVRSSIEVRASTREIAEAQVELEEKQRVLGVFPNFYASYAPDAEPLSRSQKVRLAWRFVNDPVALAIAGITAGSEQRADAFHGYGGGPSGYTKRYGAAYADGLTSTMLGQALLPALFHQDPRYFVKGRGAVGSRMLYAMASMVICKGDNRRWQPNYSNLLGNFAAAGLSNAYYPSADRGGASVVRTALTATALGAVGGLFQEFLLHRMTPHVPEYGAMR